MSLGSPYLPSDSIPSASSPDSRSATHSGHFPRSLGTDDTTSVHSLVASLGESDPEGLPFMEGDQEKPGCSSSLTPGKDQELAGGASTLPISLTGMRGPPKLPFLPRGVGADGPGLCIEASGWKPLAVGQWL